jgi:uncharacterized membrane protein
LAISSGQPGRALGQHNAHRHHSIVRRVLRPAAPQIPGLELPDIDTTCDTFTEAFLRAGHHQPASLTTHEETAMSAPDPTRTARIVLGTAFTGAGIAHIVKHEWFEQLVPEQLSQWRKPISAVTAVIQIVGGISMFLPRWRPVARWANLAMLVPTLPAAADQINHPDVVRKAGIPPALAPERVVAQILVAALTWWATQPPATARH